MNRGDMVLDYSFSYNSDLTGFSVDPCPAIVLSRGEGNSVKIFRTDGLTYEVPMGLLRKVQVCDDR